MSGSASSFTPQKLPRLCVHKVKGAYVRIAGKFHYLGTPGTPATDEKYRALCARLLTMGTPPPPAKDKPQSVTVRDVVDCFKEYSKRRGVFSSYANRACIELLELYGSLAVDDLGPLKVKVLLVALAARTEGDPPRPVFCRTTINKVSAAIKVILKHGVSEEMVQPSTLAAVDAVASFRAGELNVRESQNREPVPDDILRKTCKKAVPLISDICRLLRWTGARPAELLGLTPSMVDRSGPVWVARIEKHKTSAKGKIRFLCFGPQAQKVLAKYFFRAPDALCFTNSELAKQRNAGKTGRRDNQKPNPRKTDRKRGELITPQVLQHAVADACAAAKVTRWVPYQLRHSCATQARSVAGLDGAQVLLGHSGAAVTEIYAQADIKKAAEIALRIG